MSVLQKIINSTWRSGAKDIHNLARWIRCLFQMALTLDDQISLHCLEQATSIARKRKGVYIPYSVFDYFNALSTDQIVAVPQPLPSRRITLALSDNVQPCRGFLLCWRRWKLPCMGGESIDASLGSGGYEITPSHDGKIFWAKSGRVVVHLAWPRRSRPSDPLHPVR
jgi:hypothetical protein